MISLIIQFRQVSQHDCEVSMYVQERILESMLETNYNQYDTLLPAPSICKLAVLKIPV